MCATEQNESRRFGIVVLSRFGRYAARNEGRGGLACQHFDAFVHPIRKSGNMKISGSIFRPPMRCMTMALIAFVAGCGGGGGGTTMVPAPVAATPTSPDVGGGDGGTTVVPEPVAPTPISPGAGGGADGNSHGPTPLNLQTAGNFAVVAETAITTVSPSVINGNVGLSPASGANMGLTCSEVRGTLYTVDSDGPPPCQTVAPDLLSQVVADGHAAWHVARDERPADYTEMGGGNIGGMTLPPATYRWSTGVQIPANLTLKGGPNDVWIFLIEHDLIVSPGAQVLLEGGALPQNIFWVTLVDNVEIGAGANFKGAIFAETFIDMKTGASIDGRLLAAQGINLDGNTVTQP